MGLVHTMRTAQTNLGTTCAVPAVPRRSRQKTSKTTTSRTPSKIAISTTDAKSPCMSRTLHRAPCRAAPYSVPDFHDEDGPAEVRLMARTVSYDPRLVRPGLAESPLTCGYTLERVTRIGLALSAWESAPSRLLCPLTCGTDRPSVTVRDRSSPGLMAR